MGQAHCFCPDVPLRWLATVSSTFEDRFLFLDFFLLIKIRNKRDFENELIKKLNAKRFLKHIIKVNDVSALSYAIIKLKSEEYKV